MTLELMTVTPVPETTPEPRALLERLRAFGLPGGEEAARLVRGVRITERGEMRSGPGARWIPFTAEQTMDATRSGFCWEARLRTGPFRLLAVTDAYEGGHGRAVVKLGGVVPVANGSGPDFDKGELQRYLAQIPLCPPSLLNHPSLEWVQVGPGALRVRDREDSTCATVDLEIAEDGRAIGIRGDRPRTIGKHTVSTPWSGTFDDPREWDGIRVPTRVAAAWHLPEGEFIYYKGEVTSLVVLR